MTSEPAAGEAGWISIHIHYASYPEPLLLECLRPLTSRLRERRLILGYFFIRYWFEGPHIRLRLLPEPGREVEVRCEAEQAIGEFLRRRPALYTPDAEELGPLYKGFYLAEYGEEAWDEAYGAGGVMPIRPTNTMSYEEYTPEYHRYGGPVGVAVAEWHFEHSSDMVLDLITAANVHVRPVLLGQSLQMSLTMCDVLLDGEDDAIAEFFAVNRRYWERSHNVDPKAADRYFDAAYGRCAARLRERITALRDGVRHDEARLTPMQRGWVRHARELRRRLDSSSGIPDDFTVGRLLGSYLHMTNNRLGVTIPEEIYLSHLLRRALLPEPAGTSQ